MGTNTKQSSSESYVHRDTHPALMSLVGAVGTARAIYHAHFSCLTMDNRTWWKQQNEINKENVAQAEKDVLEYVNRHYERKVK